MAWQKISRGLSLMAATIGFLCWLGWLFHIPFLTRLSMGLVTMKANTALCLVMLGVATWILARGEPPRPLRIFSNAMALMVILIGFLTLWEHVGNIDLKIDNVFFLESAESAGKSFPGRMGPLSAMIFMLLGTAVILLNTQTDRGFRISQRVVVVGWSLTFTIFLGYFYHVEFPRALEKYFSIALHTVVAFTLLFLALLLARPGQGMLAVFLARDEAGAMARRLLPSALLVPALSGWILVQGREKGYYGKGVPVAVLAGVVTIVFTWLIWTTAKTVQKTNLRRLRSRRNAQARLRESEERYRAFIRNSAEGIWRLEFEPPLDTRLPAEAQLEQAYLYGRIAECNEMMARMYGLKEPAELVGKSLDTMLPASDPGARSYLLSIIQNGYRAEDQESCERDAAGRTVYFSNSMVGIVEDHMLRRIWGTQKQITDHKQAQDALMDSERRFRGIFDNAAVGMALMDLEGKWLQVNDLICSITGMSKEDLLGKSFMEITHQDDFQADWENAQRLMRGEISTYSMEKRYRHRDSKFVWVNLTVSLLRDHEGKPRNFISVVEDITVRKQTLEALSDSIEEAEESRQRAEAASRAKDDFLAALSHELRTPLTPVLMSASELVHDERLPGEVREQILMICRNVTLEARLIDDLLDLTRITNGKLAMSFSVVDVHELLGHTKQIIASELRPRQLVLMWQLEATHHFVRGDGARLQQVFWNLLKNAIKFTPDGGSISVKSRNAEKDEVVISIADTGRGIRPEDIGKIFRPFEQGTVDGGHSFGGLGLGLSISQAVIQLHEGELEVFSEGPGKGSVFTIRLASVAAKENPPERIAPPVSSSQEKIIRILLVEDDASTLDAATRLLRRRGYHIHPASSVAQALEICREHPIDLLVTDIGLPDGTGISLMKQIGKYGFPGIAVSGYGMEHDMKATREAGFSAHLIKPINIGDLARQIEVITQGRGWEVDQGEALNP